MGEAKNWKKKFLADHPFCCFCGGKTPAVEPDHQPGRVFFRDRRWPEGFVFPSCEPCNRISREAEAAVSLITSHFDDEPNLSRYQKRVDSIRRNFPELIASLRMTSNQKRKAASRIGVKLAPGTTYSGLPLLQLDQKLWWPHLRLIGKKLAMGMHYQCFKRPLPHQSRINLSFHTNADPQKNGFLDQILELTPQLVMPKRDKTMLGDQFAIRQGSSCEFGASVFVVNIQQRLVISALSVEDPSILVSVGENDWHEQPFIWQD